MNTRARRTIDYYRERCDPPFTQLGLARALDKHVNTIQYWERNGVSRPANLLALAALFVKHGALPDYATALRFWEMNANPSGEPPAELARLFVPPSSVLPSGSIPERAPLPDGSLMPLRYNPLFVGREAELRGLASDFAATDSVVITGIGGMGKTQLAAEFVHRYGQFFPGGVFWLSFAAAHVIPSEIAACGTAGRVGQDSGFALLPLDEQVRRVQRAWQSAEARLLVFDNCEDEVLLARWRPATGGCRVLLTSRRAAWSLALGVVARPLQPLARPSSVALLRRHTSLGQQHDIQAIAAELGDLPLALQLAGSFLERYAAIMTPSMYYAQLRSRPTQLHQSLQSHDFSPTGHEQSVARTFALSYSQLQHGHSSDNLARLLLQHAACFAQGEPIERRLLLASAGLMSDDLAVQMLAGDALARLVSDLGLLEEDAGGTLRLHRLLAMFIQAASDCTAARIAVAQSLLDEAKRLNDQRLPEQMLRLQAHLRAATDATLPCGDALAAELCATLGWQLVLLSVFDEAEHYLEQAYTLRAALFGGDHYINIDSLGLMGLLYQFQGQFQKARPYYEQALAMSTRLLGLNDFETGTCHNNLGYLLFHLECYGEAQYHLRRALAVQKAIVGLRDLSTARILNNLGYVLLHAGRFNAARRYLTLALAIREQCQTGDNPAAAQTLNNLGEVFLAKGDYTSACRCHQRALAMRTAVFGPNHYDVAESLSSLSRVLSAQRKYSEACDLLEQALAICEASLGTRNLETALKCDALGELHFLQGKHAAAHGYFERAIAVYTGAFPPGHRNIVRVQGRLSDIAAAQGAGLPLASI